MERATRTADQIKLKCSHCIQICPFSSLRPDLMALFLSVLAKKKEKIEEEESVGAWLCF